VVVGRAIERREGRRGDRAEGQVQETVADPAGTRRVPWVAHAQHRHGRVAGHRDSTGEDGGTSPVKGPDRPLNGEADRSHLLAALDCVDAVVIFDEPTPEAVLTWLRPDVWVKGGDYADGGPDLPEAELVQHWGGQTVIVPYLDGHSTTRTIAAAQAAQSRR
jgi:rfaE bifunctional protein nucleotidyltransferase chain/domain